AFQRQFAGPLCQIAISPEAWRAALLATARTEALRSVYIAGRPPAPAGQEPSQNLAPPRLSRVRIQQRILLNSALHLYAQRHAWARGATPIRSRAPEGSAAALIGSRLSVRTRT